MLTEKLAQDIALAAQAKLQNVKTAGLSRQQLAAILGTLGIGGAVLAAPAIGQTAADAGTAAGTIPTFIGSNDKDNPPALMDNLSGLSGRFERDGLLGTLNHPAQSAMLLNVTNNAQKQVDSAMDDFGQAFRRSPMAASLFF